MSARKLFDDDLPPDPPPPQVTLRLYVAEDDDPGRCRISGPASSVAPVPKPPDPMPDAWTLRAARDRFQRDWHATRKSATWSQYQTILGYWERYHEGPGPVVNEITTASLTEFFYSVPEWGSAKTWERVAKQIGALLRSCCRQHDKNREGLPRCVTPPCRQDELPFVVMPAPEWFRENRKPGEFRSGGHTPKKRSTLSLEQFQRVIDACWTTPGIDPVWWETLYGWIWFSGMRISQARTELQWSDDGQSEGVDLRSLSLVTYDSKCEGEIFIPIPECLRPGLTWLKFRTGKTVFERKNVKNDAAFRKRSHKIWDHAIPVADDVERELQHFDFHELRAVSITNWDLSTDRAAGHLITGHSAGDTREECYFKPGDARFRAIVNRYEMPKLHAAEKALRL